MVEPRMLEKSVLSVLRLTRSLSLGVRAGSERPHLYAKSGLNQVAAREHAKQSIFECGSVL